MAFIYFTIVHTTRPQIMKTTTPKSVKIGRFMHFPTTLNIGCQYIHTGDILVLFVA